MITGKEQKLEISIFTIACSCKFIYCGANRRL